MRTRGHSNREIHDPDEIFATNERLSKLVQKQSQFIEQQAATIARLSARISADMIESRVLCCSVCSVNAIIQERLNNVE